MFGFKKKKFRIREDDYDFISSAVFKATKFLNDSYNYQPGCFGDKMQVFKIYGSSVTWIDPWFFLGSILENLDAQESSREKIARKCEKKISKYFNSIDETEKEMKKRDPVAYQYKVYELMILTLFEFFHNNNAYVDEQDYPKIENILTEISHDLMILDTRKTAA